MDVSELIETLSRPTAYPFPTSTVEVRQTHISIVFLAGSIVYKIKKPVNPGFLDFSTLTMRRHFCDEEVRLNRRLAPQVYAGVVPVTRSADGLTFEGDGEVVEWAVKMQRLPDEATLQTRLRRGCVDGALVEALARRIAGFHQEADNNERIATFGRFDVVARVIRDVFTRAAPMVATTVSASVFERTSTLTGAELTRLHPIIDERAARGVTRDCHGDLHLDHIYVFPDRKPPADLVIIDCIEFNEQFRFIDPIADMAFTAMDLTFHARRDLTRAFVEAYIRAMGDEEGRALLPLYTAYRASVRGMVEGLKLAEAEVPAAERSKVLIRARAHWLMALGELEEPGRKPCLILVTGLPGSGKSTLSRGLAEAAGFQVIRSDVVRKELAGVPAVGQSPSAQRESLYTDEWNERTYSECLKRAERLLFEGTRVLVDATFREERQRLVFLETAARWGVPAVILICSASPEIVRLRLARRTGDASDADWSVYQHIAARWEKPGGPVQRNAHVVSTEISAETSVARAMDVLRQVGLHG